MVLSLYESINSKLYFFIYSDEILANWNTWFAFHSPSHLEVAFLAHLRTVPIIYFQKKPVCTFQLEITGCGLCISLGGESLWYTVQSVQNVISYRLFR